MKEHIYTIPINDAFDTDCECPICHFMKQEEMKIITYTLGASMMEPDERERTNASGFCKHHFSKLLAQTNKLSLALILETHLTEIRKKMEYDSTNAKYSKKNLFGKNDNVSRIVDNYNSFNNGCVICDKLDDIENKFVDNILELYKTENEFQKKFERSKGFCLPHFTLLVEMAQKVFFGEKLKEFYDTVYDIEVKNLNRVQEDITWFTKKFDFRNSDADWKNSKDAVPRTTEKIIGYVDGSDN